MTTVFVVMCRGVGAPYPVRAFAENDTALEWIGAQQNKDKARYSYWIESLTVDFALPMRMRLEV